MGGTRAGGIKARETNYKEHGRDFYRHIGYLGGTTPTDKPKGFAANPALARAAGRKGGKISSRLGVANGENKRGRDKRDS